METARVTRNVREVAKRLGISQSHCYDLVREGKLPAIRLGSRIVVPLSALDRFLDETSWQSTGDIEVKQRGPRLQEEK
jgi:excisionase family DNA binding protein